jgi:hypothetical protein
LDLFEERRLTLAFSCLVYRFGESGWSFEKRSFWTCPDLFRLESSVICLDFKIVKMPK